MNVKIRHTVLIYGVWSTLVLLNVPIANLFLHAGQPAEGCCVVREHEKR